MSAAWTNEQERGNEWALNAIAWLTRHLGYRTAAALLYPLSLYFLLTSHGARRASRAYLKRVLGHSSWIALYRHHLYFATTLLHRLFFALGRHNLFVIEAHGAELVRSRADAGKGCIVLGAHFGSFEVLRYVGLFEHLPVHILMHQGRSRGLNALLHRLNPAFGAAVIPLGAPDSLFRVQELLEQGAVVGMLGDRTAGREKAVVCPFLGGAVAFPTGPMQLAAALHAPVVLAFGVYRGGRRYDLYFESLGDISVRRPKAERAEDLAALTGKFVSRLEHYCRQAPYNWFNFYDYWNDA